METKCSALVAADEFTLSSQATQDTEWIQDPTDPTKQDSGMIKKGETVWFHESTFGSGPRWQQVRLGYQQLVYINPHHFEQIDHA